MNRLWSGTGLVLLALLVAGGGVLVARTSAPRGVPLDPNIPNEQLLIHQGLSGAPGPDAPSYPIAVDRVLVDGAATYVQYHGSGYYPPSFDLLPALFDDRGNLVNDGGSGRATATGWTLPFALPAWFAWQAPVTIERLAILGPLPLSSRAAILRFGNGEVVRVPLNQAALRRQRVSHPRRLYFLGSVMLHVDDVTDTHIIVEFSPLDSIMGNVMLTAHSRRIPLDDVMGECGGASANGYPCRFAWVFPPQRHGTHMALTIPSFGMTGSPGFTQVMPGAWHIAVTVP